MMNSRTLLGVLNATLVLVSVGACSSPHGSEGSTENVEKLTSNLVVPLSLGPAFHDYGGTQCNFTVNGQNVGMHCCPGTQNNSVPSVMLGAHVTHNVFSCAPWQENVALGAPHVDTSTQRNGMHVCPPNEVMVGFHESKNLLVCRTAGTLAETTNPESGSSPTQDGYPMHVCGSSIAMSGIHVAQNRFSCVGRPPQPWPPL